MDFDQENSVRFVKIKFFLKFIFILILITAFNFFVKIYIKPSEYYVFKKLSNSFNSKSDLTSSETVFMKDKLFSVSGKEFSSKILYDSIIGASKDLYVLSFSNNNYSVYSLRTNKFLFSFSTSKFVFVLNDNIFTVNELYKTLESYGSTGKKTLNLNFLSSILSVEYNNGILALGLANGQVYIYRYGNLIYIDDPKDKDEIVYATKLSPDSKYLGIARGKGKASFEVINLDNNFQKVYSLYNLDSYDAKPSVEIDNNLNIFISTRETLMILNLNSKKVFNMKNNSKILRIHYDLNNKTYKIYFYDELNNIINVRSYLKGSFKLKDNIFMRDKVTYCVDFHKGILYMNENFHLCYLGINL